MPLKGIEQIDADIFIFDESQRLSINQVNTFITTNKTLIFAHDVKQRLNRRNQAEEVVALIKKTARDDNHYEINTKIRQNKEIASFIRKFFQLARIREDEMKGDSYKDISFYYVTDNNNAKIYIEYLKEQGWEHIYLTTSNYTSENLDSVHFGSMQSAHKAIGQEFNNVVVIITPDFYGEVPSVSSIYAYLNGNIELKADFIPFIAEALGVFEQELFSPSSQNAQKIIEKLYKRQLNLHRYYNILENLEHLTPKTLEILEKIANENKSKLKEFNEFSHR